MPKPISPFHRIPHEEWLTHNATAFAVSDKFPVSPGHTLVVPFRKLGSWWAASAEEQGQLLALVADVKALLDRSHSPDGYNVGFNAGRAAGQTVDQLHLHVIPRYDGDVGDPRGGIRHIIPGRGNYLATSEAGNSPDVADLFNAHDPDGRLSTELIRCLRNPAFDRVDFVVSFVMKSGLSVILDDIDDALGRGARFRVLTTDYLDVTDPDALGELLDRQELSRSGPGSLRVRVWHDPSGSFHPKAYLFRSRSTGLSRGLVGSSNLSRSGIHGGIEWSLGVDEIKDLRASFKRLWKDPRALPLTHEFLRNYRERHPQQLASAVTHPAGADPAGVPLEAPQQPVAPTPIQQEALAALETTRHEGFTAGLVVMATGLGKTWLAAFDSARPAIRRALFVAHREEILRQSLEVFRRVRPDAELGLFLGTEKTPDADIVFASVQTLHRHLGRFPTDAFDYIVVDEFHHAAASSYRKVLNHFDPTFLLGLTATPDRMDGADLLALCGDNLVFECDLVSGISQGQLSPFRYVGIKDITDFAPIPWRNGRFDPDELARAVETRERADRALAEWRDLSNGPTLAFCCSITHANFMTAHFESAGVRAAAVHSGPGSAPRRDSVRQLRDGKLDIIFTVDVFNEGVDMPEIGTVMMLRPTESPIVFLQQLGRGLRKSEASGKEHLQVIDFIGNHHSFLAKPRALLSLGSPMRPTPSQVVDAMRSGDFNLPPGCSVDYELAAVDLMASLAKSSRSDELADWCLQHTEDNDHRPTAVQALRAGLNPATARKAHNGWFGLLDDLGLLGVTEADTAGRHGDDLVRFETEPITKSYKLVTLRALLHLGALRSGVAIEDVCSEAQRMISGDPRLRADVESPSAPDPRSADPSTWAAFWRQRPIQHLTEGDNRLFRIDGDRLEPAFTIGGELGDAFDAMVAEIVEWRLAEYLLRRRPDSTGPIRCRIGHAQGLPLITLDRSAHPGLPHGWVAIRVGDGRMNAHFVKNAISVAERPGEVGNALQALLRGWFGPSAGQPGTRHSVALTEEPDGWHMIPVDDHLGTFQESLPLFPTYEVACGAMASPETVEDAQRIALSSSTSQPIDAEGNFVAFAAGTSMDGGADPISPGDPLLFEWARNIGRDELIGERVLVQQMMDGALSSTLKRLDRDERGWLLRSDAASGPALRGDSGMRIAARLVGKLDQGDINPLGERIGEVFKRSQVPELFGDAFNPGRWGMQGHISFGLDEILFVTLNKENMDTGADYEDRFDGPGQLVWSSQRTTAPDSPKARRVLDSPGNGRLVHLFCRWRKKDTGFFYCGLVIPLSHEGSKPMSVRFRLLTPLSGEMQAGLLKV